MTEHRLSADDEALLLRGETPDGRSELQMLAQSLAEFRGAALGLAPRASATLAARLASDEPLPESDGRAIAPRTSRRVLVGRIAAASIALIMIVSAFGSANALPPAAQVVFDRVVTSVVPGSDRHSPLTPAIPLQPTTDSRLDDPSSDDTETDHTGNDGTHGKPSSPKPTPPGNSGNPGGGAGENGKANSGNKPDTAPGVDKKDR